MYEHNISCQHRYTNLDLDDTLYVVIFQFENEQTNSNVTETNSDI